MVSIPNNRQGVQSLEKGIAILGVLNDTREPLRLSEIAVRVGMSRSLAHAYLASLVRTGMVTQDAETGKYDLGEAALRFGMTALRRLDLLRLGRETLSNIQRATGETVYLATWSERGPLIISKLEPPEESVYALQMGAPVSFFPSTTGRVFMSYLPRAKWDHLLPGDVERAQLDREIETIIQTVRKNVMAALEPSTLPAHATLSAPIFDCDGAIKGTLSVVGPRGKFDHSLNGKNAAALHEAARELSAKLGFRDYPQAELLHLPNE